MGVRSLLHSAHQAAPRRALGETQPTAAADGVVAEPRSEKKRARLDVMPSRHKPGTGEMTTLCLALQTRARNIGLAIAVRLRGTCALQRVVNMLHSRKNRKPLPLVRVEHSGMRGGDMPGTHTPGRRATRPIKWLRRGVPARCGLWRYRYMTPARSLHRNHVSVMVPLASGLYYSPGAASRPAVRASRRGPRRSARP